MMCGLPLSDVPLVRVSVSFTQLASAGSGSVKPKAKLSLCAITLLFSGYKNVGVLVAVSATQ